MLSILIKRAKSDGQIRGIVPNLVDGGLSILQYTDDTIIFMDHDLDMARNMKLLLCAFEHLSGIRINFNKSELYCFGKAQYHLDSYMEIFGCKVGEHSNTLIHYKKRLSSSKGKYLSIEGRLTLINSVLSRLPMYMMSFFDAPKGGDEQKKKYRLTKWSILSQPKDQGRLRIHELGTKNITLLSKWLYKLLTSNGTWQQLIRNKYLGSIPLSQVEWRPGDSHFWSGLLRAKWDFLRFSSFQVRNGSQVLFWEDIWLGPTPLRSQYPSLYNIARPKSTTIAEVLSSSPTNLSWRRDLVGPKLVAWNHLLPRIANIDLSQEPDHFHLNLTQNGVFSVKSLYQALIQVEVLNLNKKIWKLRAPLKVKIFLLYLRKGVLLSKDNLAKHNWQGNKSCVFCHNVETIDHLFFECRFARIYIALLGAAALCWSLWIGYIYSSPLGAFLGYPSKNGFTGSWYESFACVGSGGYGYLILGVNHKALGEQILIRSQSASVQQFAMDLNPRLLLAILVLASLLAYTTPAIAHENLERSRRTYIVRVQPPPDFSNDMSSTNLDTWYTSFLPPFMRESRRHERPFIYTYKEAILGFAVNLTQVDAEHVTKRDGVLKVYEDYLIPLMTTHTPEFLGLRSSGRTWNSVGMGEGTIIGLLDSGIDISHASFHDDGMRPPPAKWRYGAPSSHPGTDGNSPFSLR
ncbi:hypothetical protein U9M48_036908 [Paspalum notatum var. saurae]|uniref:Reverse transcriptase domain-containing protein n=1 Tax=Paspalum notatum var. saurae TaxID=547442 RepID=A0AAQ3UG09_PASNO